MVTKVIGHMDTLVAGFIIFLALSVIILWIIHRYSRNISRNIHGSLVDRQQRLMKLGIGLNSLIDASKSDDTDIPRMIDSEKLVDTSHKEVAHDTNIPRN